MDSKPSPDPVVLRQMPEIERIIRDETRLESERQGRPVGRYHPDVLENVCRTIIQNGAAIRARCEAHLRSQTATG